MTSAIDIRCVGMERTAANDGELSGGGGCLTDSSDLSTQIGYSTLAFTALMCMASKAGLDVGWSKYDVDGRLHFGGGWVLGWIKTPSGLLACRHIEEFINLSADLEKPCCITDSEQDQTLKALVELSACSLFNW